MGKVTGDIAISVGADVTPLQKGMAKGSKHVRTFGGDVTTMSKNIAKAGAIVATAAAAMGAGLLAAGKRAAAAAVEVNNLSNVANAGTVEFQKMAAATSTVNISQEKLSDILKDVNDRIGDFVTTGGGPMKDFFENIGPLVGVTADQFARLSGPEALQLFYDSLEKANLSQQEMTFYLEAMASDTTALIPLLRNGGLEIKRLGDEAQRAGRIISDDLIKSGVDLDETLSDASDTISTSFNVAILENSDVIGELSDVISDVFIPVTADLVSAIGDVVTAATAGTGSIREFLQMKKDIEGQGAGIFDKSNPIPDFNYPLDVVPESIRKNIEQAIQMGDLGLADEIMTPFKPGTGRGGKPNQEVGFPEWQGRRKTDSSGGGRSRGGGGSIGPDEDDLERLQEQFATEAEILQDAYEANLERLAEYRASKLATEEEFNELESRIHKDHLDKQDELDRKSRDIKLKALSGVFSNLSSLMRTENKKLFEIGKAAAIAGATIDGIRSAISAHKHGMATGGPLLAAAYTVGSLAKTGVMISSLQSQSSGGGGGGASVGGGVGVSATAAAPQVSDSRTVYLDLGGNSVLNSLAGQLIPAINEEIENGGQIRFVTT